MLSRIGVLMFLASTSSAFEREQQTRFAANSPLEVVRCLNSAPQIGCSTFSCLENSTCDTDGMHDICNIFLHAAAVFNTEGKTFVKESIKCIANGISSRAFQTIRRCGTFQKLISDVQEECYKKLDICGIARSNAEAIGEVVQVPRHFPNRYYSTLLQSLLNCDEETVDAVRSGLVARLGPDMLTFFQLLQKKHCPPQDFGHSTAAIDDIESFRWPMGVPMFKIQTDLHNREPNHLFAKKRSIEDKLINTKNLNTSKK